MNYRDEVLYVVEWRERLASGEYTGKYVEEFYTREEAQEFIKGLLKDGATDMNHITLKIRGMGE